MSPPDAQTLYLNEDGSLFYLSGANPVLEEIALASGPAQLTEIEFGFVVVASVPDLRVDVRFWDGFNAASSPVNSGYLGGTSYLFGPAVPGAYVTGSLPLAAPVEPTGRNLAVQLDFRDGSTNALIQATVLFAGGGVTVGSSTDRYYRDTNTNGQFDAAEAGSFGGGGSLANFFLHVRGATLPPSAIELSLDKGPGEDVTLTWTGGLAAFGTYRSTSPRDVVRPGNLLAESTSRSLVDTTSSSANLYFYQVQEVCPNGSCPLAEVPEPAPAEPCQGCDGGGQDAGPAPSVSLFSGEFHLSAVDLRIKGRGLDFVWARKYRSRTASLTEMGQKWDFSYNLRIGRSGPDVILQDGNTRSDLYVAQPDGTWARRELFRVMGLQPDGSYRLTFPDTGQWNFKPLDGSPAQGRIETIVDRNGNTLSFAYDLSGRLSSITDTLGRVVTVQYDADGFIESVTDFVGRQVRYAHYHTGDPSGSAGDLASVTTPMVIGTPNGNDFPLGKTTVYTYSSGMADPLLDHNLLTITDPKGQTYLRNTYDPTANYNDPTFNHLTRQAWGDPGDVIDFVYVPEVPDPTNGFARNRAIVNDRVGNVREYLYDSRNRLVVRREYTGRADPDLPTTDSSNRPTGRLRASDPDYFETRWTYNDDSLPTSIARPNLNTTLRIYEFDLDPLAPRRSRGNLRQVTRNPGPLGGDQAGITESFTYEPGFGGAIFVKSATDGRGNTTTHTYDAKGNRVHTDHRAGGGVEDWSYNAFGQATSHTLPANGSGYRRVDTYAYHAAGPQMGYLQAKVVDSGGFGLTAQYEVDLFGNVVRKVLPGGADTLYTYNPLDQVVRTLSPEVLAGIRYETLIWYDANDNVVRTDVDNRDDNGLLQPNTHFSTIYEYEILDRPTRVCQERGSAFLTSAALSCASMPAAEAVATEYGYDANRNHMLTRYGEAMRGADPFNTVATLYDERDLPLRSVRAAASPAQSTDQTDYDGNGNVRSTSQGLESAPRVRTFAYDGYDRRTAATDPMGNVTTSRYDADGNVISERADGELLDIAGSAGNLRLSETSYQYDGMDRLVRQDKAHFDVQPPQPPIGDGFSTTQWTYADNSQVTSQSEDNPGHVTVYGYDTANRRSLVTDARGNTVASSYDANSNLVQTVETDLSDLGNPAGLFTTVYSYDPLDRLIGTTDNVGSTVAYSYDSRGNRVLHTDAGNNETRYSYDGLNRLVLTARDMNGNGVFGDPADIVTQQTWDDSSHLAGRTDDNGNVTAYRYDSLDRDIGPDYADCTTDSVQYDVHDNAVSTTDANGSVVSDSYDQLNRLTTRTIAPGPGVSADTTLENYRYDGLSRLVSAQDNDSLVSRGSATTSGYDSLSRVLRETQRITVPIAPARSITVQYDGEGNPTRLAYPGGRAVVRSYGVLDQPLVVNDDPPAGSPIATYSYLGPYRVERRDFGNATRYTPSYDGIRRIVGTSHALVAGGLIDDRTYAWDPSSNKLEMHRNLPAPPEDRFYSYDAANRLVQSQVASGGPPSSIDYLLDGVGNRISVAGGTNPGSYTMDPLLCEPGDYQMNQYSTTPFNPQRLYDLEGNVTSIPGISSFIYDYRNRLVQFSNLLSGQTTTYSYDCLDRRIDRSVNGVVTRFYYDGRQVIEEQSAANATAATFVWGPGIDVLLQMARSGQKYYYHADDVGSPMKVTDGAGSVVEGYSYGDYGKPSFYDGLANSIPQSAIANAWLLHGQYFDSESGLYWCGDRYLETGSGRYIQRTSSGIWADALGNPTAFSYNNPTSVGAASIQQEEAFPVPPLWVEGDPAPVSPSDWIFDWIPGGPVSSGPPLRTHETGPWIIDIEPHRLEFQGIDLVWRGAREALLADLDTRPGRGDPPRFDPPPDPRRAWPKWALDRIAELIRQLLELWELEEYYDKHWWKDIWGDRRQALQDKRTILTRELAEYGVTHVERSGGNNRPSFPPPSVK